MDGKESAKRGAVAHSQGALGLFGQFAEVLAGTLYTPDPFSIRSIPIRVLECVRPILTNARRIGLIPGRYRLQASP